MLLDEHVCVLLALLLGLHHVLYNSRLDLGPALELPVRVSAVFAILIIGHAASVVGRVLHWHSAALANRHRQFSHPLESAASIASLSKPTIILPPMSSTGTPICPLFLIISSAFFLFALTSTSSYFTFLPFRYSFAMRQYGHVRVEYTITFAILLL